MKYILFANTDWYLYNFRLSTALRLKADGHEVVMLSPPGEFGERFARYGLRWITLPMDRASLNPLREAVTLSHLVRVIRREQPDLLHNFTVKCAVYGGLAGRLAGTPAVVNAVAGMGYVFTSDSLKARALRPVTKWLMRGTLNHRRALLILQNPDDAEIFTRSRLVAAERIEVIRSSGVDTTRFRPTARAPGQGRLRVLLAARLVWEKGIQEYVDAARELKEQGRDIEFVLAGSPDHGNPRSVKPDQVLRWVDAGLVTWLGHVEDMPALFATVDVMALPSYYREGVPKSLIEGAAAGLALITTQLPGCREVVTRDGENGLIVEPRNASALARLIARLDDDRALVRRLGANAREKALAEFDERLVIQRTVDVYQRLLGAVTDKAALARPAS